MRNIFCNIRLICEKYLLSSVNFVSYNIAPPPTLLRQGRILLFSAERNFPSFSPEESILWPPPLLAPLSSPEKRKDRRGEEKGKKAFPFSGTAIPEEIRGRNISSGTGLRPMRTRHVSSNSHSIARRRLIFSRVSRIQLAERG